MFSLKNIIKNIINIEHTTHKKIECNDTVDACVHSYL